MKEKSLLNNAVKIRFVKNLDVVSYEAYVYGGLARSIWTRS